MYIEITIGLEIYTIGDGGCVNNFQEIEFTITDSVAHIRLHRPAAANSFTKTMAIEFKQAAHRCATDSAIRAVLISGAGRIFCAGGDLKAFLEAGDRMPEYANALMTELHEAISTLVRMNPPVIAAIHGSAAGAGMSLACAADIVIAADNARFTMGYTKAALTPDGSSTYHLPRIIGVRRTIELILTNRVLNAHEALDWGIVTSVVQEDELMDEAHRIASALSSGPTLVYGESKRLVHIGLRESLETQMENERRSFVNICMSQDSQEGRAAFTEKRPPEFRGL
jgi:2-(1,2-epoxy-1,2-dihydrophenyl)acetyl-CoA isomerase